MNNFLDDGYSQERYMNIKLIDSPELHNAVSARVRELLILSGRLWPENCGRLKIPAIRYSLKGKTAGRAWPLKWEISLNPRMAALNGDRFVFETVAHEIAHLIAHIINPKDRPHGSTWESVMLTFGQTPARLHSFDISGLSIPRKSQARYAYLCKCREHHISRVRHNRILRGAEYRCLNCRSVLKPSDQPR
jgi:SprT protein